MTEREMVQRWPQVRLDQFRALDQMRPALMDALNMLAGLAMTRHNWSHRINSDYREGDRGEHGNGNAVDIVFYLKAPGDVPVREQFEFAVGTRLFRRVGAYPYWNAPGLHLDLRPAKLFWWRDEKKQYHYAVDSTETMGALV